MEKRKISYKTKGTDSSWVNQHLLHLLNLCLMCRDCGGLQVMMVSPVYQASLVNQGLQVIPPIQEWVKNKHFMLCTCTYVLWFHICVASVSSFFCFTCRALVHRWLQGSMANQDLRECWVAQGWEASSHHDWLATNITHNKKLFLWHDLESLSKNRFPLDRNYHGDCGEDGMTGMETLGLLTWDDI